MILLGAFSVIQGNFIGGMWWVLIGVFLRSAAMASYRQLLLQDVLQNKPVREFMRRNPITVPPSISLQEWVEDYVYQYHFKMFPVVRDSELLGCISIDSIKQIPKAAWPGKTVAEVMQPVSEANSVPADAETMKLLSTMIRPDTPSRFMVLEGKQLAGMISMKDLQEFIALKLEIEPPRR